MRRARRVWSVAWRLGVVAAAVLFSAAAAASEVWYIKWEKELAPADARQVSEWFVLSGGRARFSRYEYDGITTGWPAPGWMMVRDKIAAGAGLSSFKGRLAWRCVQVEHGVWGSGWWVDVPLWPAAGAGGIASVFAVRGFRRRRPGCCRGCGYDLTGVSGVCPECGAMAASVS